MNRKPPPPTPKKRGAFDPGDWVRPKDNCIMQQGEHFTILHSSGDLGRRTARVALVEHMPGTKPLCIDGRLKSIKAVIFVYVFVKGIEHGKCSRLGSKIHYHNSKKMGALFNKYERLWPLHFAAKERNHNAIQVGKMHKRDLTWIRNLLPKLMPASRNWLEHKGYIVQTQEDGANTIQITEKGYEYFIYQGKPKKVKRRKTSEINDVIPF